MQIWKFPLRVTDYQEIPMPSSAHILAVQMQNGVPCIWAEVDEHAEKEVRTFRTYGTGHAMPDEEREYLGTYQMPGLVFHVYELTS